MRVDYFHRLLNQILELIWPTYCIGCDQLGSVLCQTCTSTIPRRHHQECIICKRPSRNGTPCTHCQSHTMVDRLIIAGAADSLLLEQSIYAIKYRYIERLGPTLAAWALDALASQPLLPAACQTNPLFVPVPLHARRLAERGFNQSAVIAQHIARTLAMQYAPDTLERVRPTASQVTTQSRWGRLENMRSAFRCSYPHLVQDRDIVLIDDVCTTGATLDACAQALKEAGARRITGLVLMRG